MRGLLARPRGSTIFTGVGLAIGVALILWVPTYVSNYRQLQFAYVGMYVIAILSQNLITGYAGQISLGQGAFMFVGAYTTAILAIDHGWQHVQRLATIPVAAGICFVAGAIVGLPALRLRGLYVALTTFALGVALLLVVPKWPHFFVGGSNGTLLSFTDFPRGRYLYTLSWSCVGILFVASWLLLRGRTGRAWRAIRDSEVAAVSSGVNLAIYKTLAFAISAAWAGVAGSLFAIIANNVGPQNFQFTLSINLVVGTAIAGFGSLWGLWLGGIILEFLPIWSQNTPGLGSNAPQVVQGLILILLMFLLPGGFAGLLRHIVVLPARIRGLRARRAEPVGEPAAGG